MGSYYSPHVLFTCSERVINRFPAPIPVDLNQIGPGSATGSGPFPELASIRGLSWCVTRKKIIK